MGLVTEATKTARLSVSEDGADPITGLALRLLLSLVTAVLLVGPAWLTGDYVTVTVDPAARRNVVLEVEAVRPGPNALD